MNDQPLPLGRNEDDRSCSPKRKKSRQKYAPKACVSCRRSKLKCSGDNPCQRCRENGKRCFFSEDQTAAEALQNLSRPSLPQQPSTSTPINNGSGLAQRTMVPRQSNERRTSNASTLGLSMETRMTRIESMVEALLQERFIYTTPSRGIHPDENGSDVDMSLSMADSVSPALAFLAQSSQAIHPQDAIDPLLGTRTAYVRVGNRSLDFPEPAMSQSYIDTFFRDFHCYYPCIDEQRFRSRSQSMLAEPDVHSNDVCFLALNYVVFACHAITNETTPSSRQSEPPGWRWLQLGDEVIGRRQLVGHGDMSLAQFLLFKAIYCTLIDQPSLAYNTIGLASRYVLQHGLNLEVSSIGSDLRGAPERLRVFWNILIVDRRISLSCNRPYTIRDQDIGVDRPSDVIRRNFDPIIQSCDSETTDELNEYFDSMIDWCRFAGSLWDSILAAHVRSDNLLGKTLTFEAAMDDYIQNTLGTGKDWSIRPHSRLRYVQMCFDNLRLMAWRASASSRTERHIGTVFHLSTTAISNVRSHGWNTEDVYLLRHQMVTTLAISLLVLCSALIDVESIVSLDLRQWNLMGDGELDAALELLSALAQKDPLAQRVLSDFDQIVPVVRSILSRWSEEIQAFGNTPDWGVLNDIIPQNAAELLPYGDQVADIRFPMFYNGLSAANEGSLGIDYGLSQRNTDLATGGARSSVLWL